MKSKLQFLKKVRLVLIAIAMFGSSAVTGATFTAVTSGNWSSTTTWGGTVPSLTITSDRVNIPSDITVMLDQNLTVNGGEAILDVEGTLTSSLDDTLSLGMGNIAGTGTITVGNINFNDGAEFVFMGSVTTSNLINASPYILLDASLMVNNSVTLTYGSLTVSSNGSFQLAANGTINISGGVLLLSGGTLNLTAAYNVNYTGDVTLTGFELTGAGLNNVTIDVSSESTLSLSNDLTVNGTFSLMSGTFVLNDHSLTINGNIAASGSGSILSTSGSDVTINTVHSPAGSLQFSSAGNVVNNFTVNITTPGSAVTISSVLTVNGSLNLMNGNINIGSNSIQLGASASISGGSVNSYIMTTNNGFLSMTLKADNIAWINFPIGTTVHYAPASVQLNAGSPGGTFQAGVMTGVLSMGTSGSELSLSQPLVDATWFVESDVTSGLNMNLQVAWSSMEEVNGFNETSAYISHYTSGNWDVSALASATAEGGGMFSLQRNGIQSLSPFAVFNQSTVTGITENTITGAFELYPNPVSAYINVKNINTPGETVYVDVFDEAGRILGSYSFQGSEFNLSVDNLNAGTYFLKLYNDKASEVKRFEKIMTVN